MEPVQALQITKYLSEAYPRDEWSQERYVLWADAIGDLDFEATQEAAKRWVNHVNMSAKVKATWAYLLAGEDDVRTASGSWAALKKLAS